MNDGGSYLEVMVPALDCLIAEGRVGLLESDDTPFLSLLKHLIKVEGGAAESQSPKTAGAARRG